LDPLEALQPKTRQTDTRLASTVSMLDTLSRW